MSVLAIKGGTPVRSRPFPDWPVWDEVDEKALLEVLRSGVWGITDNPGSPVKKFEEEFAHLHDARFGQAVFNGTVALQTALLAVGIDYGDEVIVPAYTFLATASACLMVGAVPIFVDIDPETYNLDPGRIEEAVTSRTRAIIPVHIGGCPADLSKILEIARRHSLTVIEDACQAVTAAWNGRRVGAIADAGCFSFQSSKNLNAGEGGIILTDDQQLADRCWSVHNCGRVREGAWYQHEMLGSNFRMTQWQAGILLSQMRNFEEQARIREENGRFLAEMLSEIGGFEPQRRDPFVTQHGYHLFISRYDPAAFHDIPRDLFLAALQAEGIPCASGYQPLYRMNAIKEGLLRIKRFAGDQNFEYLLPDCPVTERACHAEGVWFGQSMLLGTRQDMDDIAKAVLKVKLNIEELREDLSSLMIDPLNQPVSTVFRIGAVPVFGDTIQAPMNGFSDWPFRSLCSELGSAMSWTEFVRADFIVNAFEHMLPRLTFTEAERPVVFQIYGDDPDELLKAALRVQTLSPDIIDINMGCPAESVTDLGAGVSLMRTPLKVAHIFQKLSRELSVPVTGKIRLGWEDNLNYRLIARIIEESGGAAITVHGRTQEQGYRGRANWDAIAEVKQAARIPVIGNGDIKIVQDIEDMQRYTGCDAVMIGRAAVGNPWIFAHLDRAQVSVEMFRQMVHQHLHRSTAFYGEHKGLFLFRRHALPYLKFQKLPRDLRTGIISQKDARNFLTMLDAYYAAHPDA